ncbi:MAG: class I SAM-dependent methyltransferase [Deltaproteobacteria bacterium]|nr:class I SAM-dependent methyltransferase [Deltaproteobacteria bacterium]
MSEPKRRFGKQIDYYSLGKSFADYRLFMEHMQEKAEALWCAANRDGKIARISICPICNSEDTVPVINYAKFDYLRCNNPQCQHVFVASLLDRDYADKFFAKDEQYSDKNYCSVDKINYRVENIAKPKVKYILQHTKDSLPGAWLDVGCGSGEILFAAKNMGWDGIGLELNDSYASFGKRHFGIDILNKTLEDYLSTGRQFDIISFIGVLHCVVNPLELLKQSLVALKPNGIIAAEISNFNSLTSAAVRTFPKQPTRSFYNGITTNHLFTEESAIYLFSECRLNIIAVWHFGADIYELLNQLSFLYSAFAGSKLHEMIVGLANDFQLSLDKRKLSEKMLLIAARK